MHIESRKGNYFSFRYNELLNATESVYARWE